MAYFRIYMLSNCGKMSMRELSLVYAHNASLGLILSILYYYFIPKSAWLISYTRTLCICPTLWEYNLKDCMDRCKLYALPLINLPCSIPTRWSFGPINNVDCPKSISLQLNFCEMWLRIYRGLVWRSCQDAIIDFI